MPFLICPIIKPIVLTLDCPAEDIVEFAKCLRDEETFDLLVDLTAIDHGKTPTNDFPLSCIFIPVFIMIIFVFIRCASNDCESLISQSFRESSLPPIGMKGRPTTCLESFSRIIRT